MCIIVLLFYFNAVSVSALFGENFLVLLTLYVLCIPTPFVYVYMYECFMFLFHLYLNVTTGNYSSLASTIVLK